jgi:uncharacterized protein
MEIKLKQKPKGPIIIEGFPGLGLIGTISTEFLIKHLKAKSIGSIWSKDLMPIAAVHESKIVQPLEIFFAEKHNIIIIHALSDVKGMEWEISETLVKLYKDLDAKEIISIEGIMSKAEEPQAFFVTGKDASRKKMESSKVLELKEGIIIGVTAALMLKDKGVNSTGIFVGTHSKLPDSKSAAKVIEVLDKYLKLDVDYKPLLEAAKEFEGKLKELLEKTKESMKQKKVHPDYLG